MSPLSNHSEQLTDAQSPKQYAVFSSLQYFRGTNARYGQGVQHLSFANAISFILEMQRVARPLASPENVNYVAFVEMSRSQIEEALLNEQGSSIGLVSFRKISEGGQAPSLQSAIDRPRRIAA